MNPADAVLARQEQRLLQLGMRLTLNSSIVPRYAQGRA